MTPISLQRLERLMGALAEMCPEITIDAAALRLLSPAKPNDVLIRLIGPDDQLSIISGVLGAMLRPGLRLPGERVAMPAPQAGPIDIGSVLRAIEANATHPEFQPADTIPSPPPSQ